MRLEQLKDNPNLSELKLELTDLNWIEIRPKTE